MKTYSIVGKTNSYLANRSTLFKGKTYIVLRSGLTLKEAYKELLDMYNEAFDDNASNWGLAVIRSSHRVDQAFPTERDKTRKFEEDGRIFEIEEE